LQDLFFKMELPTEWITCPLNTNVNINVDGEFQLIGDGYITNEKVNKKGYVFRTIGAQKRRVRLYIHEAVASIYLSPKPSPDHIIFHLNGDKNNNRADNLQWLTEKEYYDLKAKDFDDGEEYKLIPNTDYEISGKGVLRHIDSKAILAKKKLYGFSKNGVKYTIACDMWRRKLFDTHENKEWRVYPLNSNYEVSSDGLIRVFRTKRMMKALIHDGYHQVDLGGTRTGMHRAVAHTFLPSPKNPLAITVNHIDGDKSNNCVDNLEWATQSEQIIHASKDIKRQKRKVISQSSDGTEVQFLGSKEAAETLNIDQKKLIDAIYRNVTIKGYTFSWLKPHYDEVVDIEGELWKQYVLLGEITNYYISNKGRVKREQGLFRLNERFKYYQLTIRLNGKSYNKQVHLMVAETFLERPESGEPMVDHIDKDTKNNTVDNLEWVSRLEQNRRASAKPIAKYNLDNQFLRYYETTQIAAESESLNSTTLSEYARKETPLKGYIYKQLPNSDYLKVVEQLKNVGLI
jgi:hypothetical protein